MPNRPWRKCETCEWCDTSKSGHQKGWYEQGECHNRQMFFDGEGRLPIPYDMQVRFDDWCSEWKSSKPETCGMCEWFFPFGDRQKGVCNHSMAQPRNYSSHLGACEHFRRKDAD